MWILFLDDERLPARTGEKIIVARSVAQAWDFIGKYGYPTFISFDHDLGHDQPTGYDFAKQLVHEDSIHDVLPADFDFFVHSQNPVGAQNIRSLLNNWLNFKKQDSGSYVCALFSRKTTAQLYQFGVEHQIPNLVTRNKFHTTIVYSDKAIDWETKDLNVKILPKSFEWDLFGDEKNCLVLKFKSPTLQARWKEAMNMGATWDYDHDYEPHVTLSYDCPTKNFPLPDFPLEITQEIHEPKK